ncbi:cation:proton antiporter [Polluticoccus soli]|uniref:cation:proton antiporter domain-containing protein n=1 Tax=Polluticoccus soli TaxID=3034150 RepID=UPI0023E1034C|nr:cation:proton antiporter [Flavipsychrobacter sp. JY13-12]
MELRAPVILILLSSIVILSYLFNLLSKKTRLPSVLMLIATGIGIKYLAAHYGFAGADVTKLVKILGATGLIMIVLEAALDLKLGRDKLRLIGDSFFSALFIFLFSAFGIGILIMQWLHVSFELAFLYAIPMSIISSAIIIPSTSHFEEKRKEFIIYESSFSDIVGILAFNYMLAPNVVSLVTAGRFFVNVGLVILLSLAATFLLLYIILNIKVGLKFFLIFSVLSFLYGLGELIHLPSLMIVLVFGLVINNYNLLLNTKFIRRFDTTGIDGVLETMRSITAETSFLIRTFFFILFGYTIDLSVLMQPDVWELGSIIIIILLLVRYFYLRVILKTPAFPMLLLMPRGLVTILLFYSIPVSKSIGGFNNGILFFVVAVSSILMMFGLLFSKDNGQYLEKSEEAI